VKTKEQDLLEALQLAERREDRFAIEQAVNRLALFYVAKSSFPLPSRSGVVGQSFWRSALHRIQPSLRLTCTIWPPIV
jgi:hypothetical protein